jgi:hypothetical protein
MHFAAHAYVGPLELDNCGDQAIAATNVENARPTNLVFHASQRTMKRLLAAGLVRVAA